MKKLLMSVKETKNPAYSGIFVIQDYLLKSLLGLLFAQHSLQ